MLFSWKMDQINYFVLKYWRLRGRNISKFWVTSLFQHQCSARAGKQQFQWRKRIANFMSKKCKWHSSNKKTKSDLSVWIRWQLSTGKNDFNGFMKNNKCSNMNSLLFSPKKADYKHLQDQTQLNWMIHFINKLRDEEVFACMCTRIQKRRKNKVTCTPNSQSQSRMNEPVF